MAEIESIGPAANPAGARLRAAREASGLTLEEIAGRTRIPTRHLRAIEDGAWDTLPASTYTIGFARAYANAVGLDGPAIAGEVRAELGGRQKTGPAPAIYEPADPARVPPRALVIVTAVLAVTLVTGYAVWRSALNEVPGETDLALAEAPPQRSVSAAARPVAPPPAPVTGPVVLTAANEVWLRVYERGGERLFEGTMNAGDRYQVPATAQAPLILTGRPDAVRVTVGTTAIPQLGPAERSIKDVSLSAPDLLARVGTAAPGQPVPDPAPPPAG